MFVWVAGIGRGARCGSEKSMHACTYPDCLLPTHLIEDLRALSLHDFLVRIPSECLQDE